MDTPDPYAQRRPSPANLSRTPSWVMLGFVLGVAFMWLWSEKQSQALEERARVEERAAQNEKARLEEKAREAKAKAEAEQARAALAAAEAAKGAQKSPAKKTGGPVLALVEAVFDTFGSKAVWYNNRTEIAVWNVERDAFADFYEVYRDEGVFYFRSIPALTRPLLAYADRPDCPILFTETEQMKRERDAARSLLVPARPAKQEEHYEAKPSVEAPGP